MESSLIEQTKATETQLVGGGGGGGGGGSVMEAVFPRRVSSRVRVARRVRHRTTPVTFAEIKEVDEDSELAVEQQVTMTTSEQTSSARDDLERRFAASRRRRARQPPLCSSDTREHTATSLQNKTTTTHPQ